MSDSTPVEKMDKAIAYTQALQKQYGSAALSVAVARLLSLQDRYAAMQADWERMINDKPYYREDVRPIVADDFTEALNEGKP